MQRVRRPAKLSRPEVRLPALLVEVREYEKQQQGDDAWQDHVADNKTIHEMTDTNPWVSRGEDSSFMVSHVSEENNNFAVTWVPLGQCCQYSSFA